MCHFDIAAGRALAAEAGSVCCWAGNTLHWGAPCNAAGAAAPRRSLGFTFRRRGGAGGEAAEAWEAGTAC